MMTESMPLTDLAAAFRAYDLDSVWPHLVPVLPMHPLTLRNHRSALKRYLLHGRANHADLLRPDPDFLEAYLLTFRSVSPGHAVSLFSRLRALYKALRTLGVVPRTYDPLLGLKTPRQASRPGEHRQHYTEPEVTRLLANARDDEERCLVLLGAHAGLRSGEVVGLGWPDVRITEADLSVRGRLVPKDGPLDQSLRQWAGKHGGLLADGQVFSFRDTYVVNRRLHLLCERAAVPYRPWTALRSTYAFRLWETTHDPRTMVDQLGIGSLKAVEAYARMTAGPPILETRLTGPRTAGTGR